LLYSIVAFYLLIIDMKRGYVTIFVCFVGESVYARKLPCKLDSGLYVGFCAMYDYVI